MLEGPFFFIFLLVNKGQYFFFFRWKEQISCFVAFTFYCSFTNCLISSQSFKKLLYFFPLCLKNLFLDIPYEIGFQASLLYFCFWFALGCYQLFVLCFVFVTEKKKVAHLKAQIWSVNLIPGVQSTVWLCYCTRLTSSPGEGILAEIWEFLDQ